MFKGRLGVKQYWLSVLVITLIQIVLIAITMGAYMMFVLPAILGSMDPLTSGPAFFIAIMFAPLVAIIPLLPFIPFVVGIQIRRLHDVNLSGWWWLAIFFVSSVFPSAFPITNVSSGGVAVSPLGAGGVLILTLLLVIIMSWPGTKGPNAYGEPYVYPSLWAAIRGKKVAAEVPPPAQSVPPAPQMPTAPQA